MHGVLAKLGVPVTCTDIFGRAGSAWLDGLGMPQPYAGDGLGMPQPYAGKVTSLRQLAAELSAEITMLGGVIADLLAGDRGYQVIQHRLPMPLTRDDERAGYWWEISMRQVEVSRTIVFDAPRRAPGVLRGPDRRQPRHRPPRQRRDHLRPQDPPRHQRRRRSGIAVRRRATPGWHRGHTPTPSHTPRRSLGSHTRNPFPRGFLERGHSGSRLRLAEEMS